MILKLTLKEPYFTLTGEEGKMFELRNNSKWILSRLKFPDGKNKPIKWVLFTNGYGKKRPNKLVRFKSFDICTQKNTWVLPNGEKITTNPKDVVIWLK